MLVTVTVSDWVFLVPSSACRRPRGGKTQIGSLFIWISNLPTGILNRSAPRIATCVTDSVY